MEAIYLVLKDSISSDYVYSVEELATIYDRRDRFMNGEEKVITTKGFIEYVRQNKL